MGKKLIQFGGGNIGRSFIGQLFSRSGYEVVFIDINEKLVDAFNERKKYRVIIKRKALSDETLWVKNVRAVNAKNPERIAEEISDAAVIATAVGKNALPHIFPVLTRGLQRRLEKKGEEPIDIIIAENIRDGAKYFHEELKKLLPDDYDIDRLVGLVETSIGKMVPIMKQEDIQKDPLWIFAEPYNTLILDKWGFRNPIPDVEGIKPVENITAYVDRKLFIHNLGHAASAYFGYQYNPKFIFIYEALEVPELLQKTRQCMEQAAVALHKEYPDDLPLPALHEHIADLLERFQNKSLGDTIFRVGRDVYRKLGKEDRLVGAMLLARKYECPCDTIAEVVVAACEFRATDEFGDLFPKDKEFWEKNRPMGIEHILQNICQLSRENKLEVEVMDVILKLNYKDWV
jgi:mannitol-1-phosphate 5-dehydrogenase